MGHLRSSTPHRRFLSEEARRLTALTATARVPGGFGWLDETCLVTPGDVHLWITARMTHVAGLALLAQSDATTDVEAVLAHGVGALLDGPLHDQEFGGWFARAGRPTASRPDKQAYDHAFVVLAASTAVAAGAARSDVLLERALESSTSTSGMPTPPWWWRPGTGRSRCSPTTGGSTPTCTRSRPCWRHTTSPATGTSWPGPRQSPSASSASRGRNGFRIPEHAGPSWQPVLEYNADRPADPFRPYGATVGHGLEWSRLLIQLDVAHQSGTRLADAAQLYDRAVSDGWAVDGAPGFVYTTDWDGKPVTHTRMHWVCCEAILAAAALAEATGDPRYEADYERWWDFAQRHLIDPVHGSWRHELDRLNRPASSTWQGKPDLYHAVQACLLPSRPLAGSAARALLKVRA